MKIQGDGRNVKKRYIKKRHSENIAGPYRRDIQTDIEETYRGDTKKRHQEEILSVHENNYKKWGI